jgi:antitoxin component YwqK of YwqJK toxin-antitoxin module
LELHFELVLLKENVHSMKALKIHQILFTAIFVLLFVNSGNAQYKTYALTEDGDTVNAVLKDGLKHGAWIIRVEALRGEPGYEEEGAFVKGEKNGVWRIYTLEGDLLAVENYKNGGKDGIQQYFTFLGALVREESWRGYDPENPYDTIAIYGTSSGEITEYKIIKAVPYSVKQGTWKYYDPETGAIVKSEKWELNNIINPGSTSAANTPMKKKEVEKTPEMLEWEKKNRGKKGAVRDGSTGL